MMYAEGVQLGRTVMSRLEISLLGPFQVRLDARPITAFEANSARALLAYLAYHAGTACQRDVVAGLLWPDYPNADALRNLRKALYRVRKALSTDGNNPPFLLATRDTIQLNPESDYEVDVSVFDQAVAFARTHGHHRAEDCAACAQCLSEAVEHYRGEFLAGFSLSSALFEEWTVVERERLQRLGLEALGQLAAYYEAQEAYTEAIEYARRALALEPWSEAVHRQLMRTLALGGDRSAALAQYEACCRVLQEELGVAPEEETTRIYEQIRDDSGTRSLPEIGSLGNLPAQSTPFVGRERELAALGRLLVAPEVRLVTVVGAGGMGKTRLALEVAHTILDRFPGGAWLVELAPLPAIHGAADDAAVPRAVAGALGVQEQPGRSLPEVIAGALQGRELLLVLDNCEHVLAGAAPLVALLLARCPDLAVFATSREPLRIAGEHVYDVPGMEVPEPPDLTGLSRPVRSIQAYDALQLFGQRAVAVRPGFDLDEEDVAVAADLCRRLDGMPLAIELAAARLRVLSLPELARRLEL
jgi:DNA-binding SARP family transcriptional activator